METIEEISNKVGRPRKIENQVTEAPEKSTIIKPTAAEIKRVGDSNVIQIGAEGITATQTLGDFEAPDEFDKVNFDMAYGCEEAGTVGAFRAVAELCQPQRHSVIGMIHPGWKIWTSASGKKHQIRKDRGVLTLLYCSKKDNTVINKAYGELSKKQLKSIESKIASTNLVLPADIRDSQQSEDEGLKMQLLAFEAMQKSA